jgi:hypothetical protein
MAKGVLIFAGIACQIWFACATRTSEGETEERLDGSCGGIRNCTWGRVETAVLLVED